MKRPSKIEDCLGKYIAGISNYDYHSDLEFVSSSQLKESYKSPENFRWLYNFNKGTKKDWKPGNAMDFGSLVHGMLLEPHLVDKEFAFMDITGRNFRTKDDRLYKATFLDMHKGKIVVTNEDKEKAAMCVEVAMEHPFVREIMESEGENEESGYFYDEFHKLHLRFRPDRKCSDLRGKNAIIDIKTTANIEDFRNTAMFKFHYDLSAHMYLEGHKRITGQDAEFYFMVIESQSPYRVGVFRASDKFLDRGREKYQQGLSNCNQALNNPVSTIRWQEADFQDI